MQDFTIGISLVNAFKYANDTVTSNRICIINEDNLPDCVDVYTNNFGSKDCAMRYIPEKKCAKWILDDEGNYFCSKCHIYPVISFVEYSFTEYCPHCGSPMNN